MPVHPKGHRSLNAVTRRDPGGSLKASTGEQELRPLAANVPRACPREIGGRAEGGEDRDNADDKDGPE